MLKFSCICFLLLIHRVLCEECVLDNGSRDLNKERKLQRDLLCNYDVFKSPQNITTVKTRFLLKYFFFENDEEIFTIFTWPFLTWNDDRLKWTPTDYDNITETTFTYYQIWMPRWMQQTHRVYDDFRSELREDLTMCHVKSSGYVSCVSQVLTQTECQTNLTNWPYDIQTCTFKFGVFTTSKENIVLTFNSSRGINMFGAEYGPGWNIIDFKKGENATSKTQIYLTFVVERQAENLESIIVFPSVVLIILTLTTLFLDIGITRGAIGILSLLCHIYVLLSINESIPKQGSTEPSILHFITTSLAFTTVSILLTIALGSLLKKKTSPQQWIIRTNEFIFKSPIKFLIWPRWEEKNVKRVTDETKMALDIWNDFGSIINTASIVVMIIVYISIFSYFVPKPIDYTPLPLDDEPHYQNLSTSYR